MKTIYYLIWILGIILYIALERKGRARLSNNYNRKVSKNYFIEKKKALNKIFRKNKKEFNKLFQNKRKLHKLILMSIISIPISFFIIYYIFIKINLIKEEAIMFAIEISIILGLVAYLSRISKIGFEVYCENMKFIDDYIYEKTGFKKIEFVSNTNKYLYEKNINNKICHVFFNISCTRGDYFGNTIWHRANIDIISNQDRKSLKISDSFQIQELIYKYSFLALKNEYGRIMSSLIFLTSSHKVILAYLYSVINLANDIALADSIIENENI